MCSCRLRRRAVRAGHILLYIKNENMKIKHILAAVFFAAYFPLTASAVPADPRPRQVRQPDGTMLTIVVRGDERGHMVYTSDGVPLFHNAATGAYEYAKLSNGDIVGSGIVATEAGMRDANAKTYIGNLDVEAMIRKTAEKAKVGKYNVKQTRVRINDFPATGKQRCLVILMDFPDAKFSIDNPKELFTRMLNEEGFTYENGANGSVRDFYIASSFGKFQPEFDVVGPVTLSQSYRFYGENMGSSNTDVKFNEAIVDACEKLDNEVDFSQYDADGDGYVDNIYFFYAGYGEADTGVADYIWPHSYYLLQGYGTKLELDGVRVDRYSCGNEINGKDDNISGIGTFVHEFGHVLGLADHYATDSYAMYAQVDPGEWDTMASGSYNNNMHTPPLFSAFERAELGWLEYTDLTTAVDETLTLPKLGDSNKAYRIKSPRNENEYYIFENRQQEGWDAYLPGHGLLLWHIDMDEDAWFDNIVNNDTEHQMVDIVEADGMPGPASYAGDPFPGVNGVDEIELSSWWNNKMVKVYDIVEEDGNIRLSLFGADYQLPAPSGLAVAELGDDNFTLEWDKTEDVDYLLTLQKDNGQGGFEAVPGYNSLNIGNVGTYTVTGIEASTTYKVELSYKSSEYTSYPATISVTTNELAFVKSSPTGLAATDVTPTGFTATWNEMEMADDYLITLASHDYVKQEAARGYDFTDKADGLPETWSTNCTQYNSSIGWYGEAAPAIRMSEDANYLVVAYPSTRIERLSFWCRSSVGGNKVRVELGNGSTWSTLASLDAPTTGTVLNVQVGQEGMLRLVFERANGYIVIDDVNTECSDIVSTPVSGYNGVSTGGKTTFTFENLVENKLYGFVVKGVNGSEESSLSDEYIVQLGTSGITAPETAGDGREAIYDLQGRRMPEGALPRGIYIVKKKGQPARKVVVQ